MFSRLACLIVLMLTSQVSNVYAGFKEGMAAYERKDFKQSYNEFSHAAELGDINAQFMLGKMYAKGEGVSVNQVEAMNLI